MNKIEFFCWKEDEQIRVQLEPEGEEFFIQGNDTLSIVAIYKEVEFKWSIRTNHKSKSIQLYPESDGKYEIQVYKNTVLVYSIK